MHNTEYDINNFYHLLTGPLNDPKDLLTIYPELLVWNAIFYTAFLIKTKHTTA